MFVTKDLVLNLSGSDTIAWANRRFRNESEKSVISQIAGIELGWLVNLGNR